MPPRLTTPSLFAPPLAEAASKTAPQPAKSTWIYAHCDGGARGNPGPAGYGALIQDESGTVLAELSEFLGMRTNNFAEYSGLLGCLQYALDHHHGRLKVVSDSELMVKQIQGKYQVKSPDLKPLYEEAKRRIARLEGFEITHALRHKNKDADRLANEAMDRGMKRPQSGSAPVKATPIRPRLRRRPFRSRLGVAAPGTRSSCCAVGSHDAARLYAGWCGSHSRGTALPDGVFVKIIPE